jgi:hypothetical protein
MAVVGLAILSAGCNLLNNDSTSPTTPTTQTETFSGTVGLLSSSSYTFTVTTAGTVGITLTALSPTATIAMGLGVGTPNGSSGCTLTSSTTSAVAGSTPQITVTENPGSYCTQISDVGHLTTASSFTITIVHP